VKTPTVPELKKWALATRPLAKAVLMAQAFADVERERVNAYIKPLFLSFMFTDEDGKPITDPDRLYLSADDAGAKTYYEVCDREHRAHGFDGPEGFCPALVAEELQREAEQALLNELGKFTGIDGMDYNRSLEIRKKALDMALGVCLKAQS
jgi:hypothetical protein